MASKPTSAIGPDCANPFDTQLNLQVILRDDPHYGSRRDSYWAVNSRLAPSCFVLPNSPEQVSAILNELVAQKRQFAIRCGGHSPVPGTNNIADGVTIDLSLLTGVTVDTDSKTVRFGAGNTWRDVYKECTKHKSTVAGGRGGDVGVSGLLLGGGSTWMSAKNGWAVSYLRVKTQQETAYIRLAPTINRRKTNEIRSSATTCSPLKSS